MVIGVPLGRSAADVVIVLLADVKFAAHDRLHARLVGRIHKMHGAKNIAVVGHGDGRHAQLFYTLNQLFDVARAVEHRVIAMQVQVDEFRHRAQKTTLQNNFRLRSF